MKKSFIKFGAVILLLSSCNFLAAEKIINHQEFPREKIKNIMIVASSGDAKVLSGKSDKIIVETYTNKQRATDAELNLSGGTLFVKATDWSMGKYPPNVRIFVPRGFSFSDLNITVSSGNAEAKNLSCDEVNISLSSGNIDVENVDCTGLILNSTSGRINIDEINSSGDVRISSTSGSVDVDDVICGRFMVEVTSGNVDADEVSCDVFEVDSTSGKIGCEELTCKKFSIESSSGKIDIALNEMVTENSSLKATSGGIYLTLPKQNPGYTALVNTTSGNFSDEFTGMKASNCNGATSVYKSGDVEITLKTNSGNVRIQKSGK